MMVSEIFASFGLETSKIFIDGRWVESAGDQMTELTNPKDDTFLARVSAGTIEDSERAVSAAAKAQPDWMKFSAIERGNILLRLADLLDKHGADLARLAMLEHGKTIASARGEVEFAALIARYTGSAARHMKGDILHDENSSEQLWTQRVPFGVTVGLTPWNFPAVTALRKLAPSLLAGNTMVLKPHELTPLATLVIAELARRAGVPPGVLNVVLGGGGTVGSALVTDPRTSLVSLTGSVRAGKEVYAAAAPNLRAVRLELGGKAPFIVMEDARVDDAVAAALSSKFAGGGQDCTANDRMYIHERVYDQFMEKFLAGVDSISVGDPETDVSIGPWVSRAEVEKLDAMAKAAEEDGATLLSGAPPASRIFEKGRWTFPKVYAVTNNAPRIMREETFGPLLAVLKVFSFEEAISYANDTVYGLSAFLWTDSNRRIMRSIQELDFGEVYINRGNGESVHGFHTGFKSSGLGGEDGMHGIEGYLRKKSMYNNFA